MKKSKLRRMVLPLISAIVCLSCVSCKKYLRDVVEEVEPATCIVYTYDEYGSPSGSGSGFFIQSDGIGVTNWHVLDKSIKAVVKTTDGQEYEIDSVLCASQKKDILVFRIKNKNNVVFKTLKFAKEKPAKGDVVYNISAPLGLETSVSEGIVASIREDSHGNIVQVTVPLSPGSSGSPLLNEDGEVFAIVSFKRVGGENVNFGILLDENFRDELNPSEFANKNRKFNNDGTDFILLNILPDKRSDLVLNAIEFSSVATTIYMTYTNMNLSSNGKWYIWCELGKKDNGFFIEDKDGGHRYYVTSSSLEVDKKSSQPIGLAEVVQFKVHFPAIKKRLTNIDIMWGEDDRTAHFIDLDLEKFRNALSVNKVGYQREYALKSATERGDLSTTMSALYDILNENPSDAISLNMMAILSYLIDNNTDALYYLDEAIEYNPNDNLAYLNRAYIYEATERYREAVSDLTKVISMSPLQPDYYFQRGFDYYMIEEYQKALNDVQYGLAISHKEDGFEDNPYLYEQRAHIYYKLNMIKEAREDVQRAYKLSKDKELDKRLEEFYSKKL